MGSEGTFEQFAEAGLAMIGVALDEVDVVVMKSLYDVYGDAQRELLAENFALVPPEPALDPSRPPALPR